MKTSRPKKSLHSRQVLGFSLDPKLALQVKLEATRRRLSLKEFFEELWKMYLDQKKFDKNSLE